MMRPNEQLHNRQDLAERMAQIPENLYVTCPFCHTDFYHQKMTAFRECPQCGYGFRLSAPERIEQLTDQFTEMDAAVMVDSTSVDEEYRAKLAKAHQASDLNESVVTGIGQIGSLSFGLGVMDAHFMMGSLGGMTGEKITRLFEQATKQQLPVVLCTASGGARMQEGLQSLMQMAKVSQAVAEHDAAGLLYVVLLTDPTTGGVTASFAMQADITLAEPHALIGFTGPRVIEQTLHVKLPENFQRAETQLAHGFVDQIVGRQDQKTTLQSLFQLHQTGGLTHDQ